MLTSPFKNVKKTLACAKLLLDNGADPNKNGLIVGVLYSVIYFLSSYASKNAHKVLQIPIKDLTGISLLAGLIFGMLAGVFASADWWAVALISFTLVYLVENARKPIMTGILADQVNQEIFTSVISALSLYRTIAGSLIAIGFGFVADQFGRLHGPLFVQCHH